MNFLLRKHSQRHKCVFLLAMFSILSTLFLLHSYGRLNKHLAAGFLNFSEPPYDPVPENFADSLHFVIFVVTGPPPLDCGGCTVLWELYYTLKAQNYSASTSMNDIVPNRTIVGIYPEVTWNSYSGVDIHVRWILAGVGINVNADVTKSWNPEDLVFNYAINTGVDVPISNLLQVVNTPTKGDETDISEELFYSKERSGIAWMMRKGPRYHENITYIHNVEGYNVTQLDGKPSIPGLRQYEYFIAYDPYTYWSWFAAMQGTLSIVYPIANVSKRDWALSTFPGSYLLAQNIYEVPGVAYGWTKNEVEYARNTMHKVRPFFVDLRTWGAEVTVPRFVRDCYRYSIGKTDVFEGALIKKDVYPQ